MLNIGKLCSCGLRIAPALNAHCEWGYQMVGCSTHESARIDTNPRLLLHAFVQILGQISEIYGTLGVVLQISELTADKSL